MQPANVGITALMAEFNQPHATIKQWLADAGIERRESDKTFPYAAAAEAIRLRTDEAATLRDRYDSAQAIGDDEARKELIAAKRDIAQENARKLRLQNAQLENSLLDRETIAATGRDLITRARIAFMAVGPKLAPRLAGESDEKKIAAMIQDECRAALCVLADQDLFCLSD